MTDGGALRLVTSLALSWALVAACQATPSASTSSALPPPASRLIATPTGMSTPSLEPPSLAPAPPDTTSRPTSTPALPRYPHTDELTEPGSLGVNLEEFTNRWNSSEGGGGALTIVMAEWQLEYDVYDKLIGAKYIFNDALDETYEHVGLIAGINDDGTLRSAMVVYIPGQSVLEPDLEELVVIYAHSALIAAVLPNTSQQERDAVLSRVSPPAAGNYGGVEASTSEAGLRFRLTDQGSTGVLFIAREDNLGAVPSITR